MVEYTKAPFGSRQQVCYHTCQTVLLGACEHCKGKVKVVHRTFPSEWWLRFVLFNTENLWFYHISLVYTKVLLYHVI